MTHLGLLVATLRGFLCPACLRQQMATITATRTRATAAGSTTYSQMLKSEQWGIPHTWQYSTTSPESQTNTFLLFLISPKFVFILPPCAAQQQIMLILKISDMNVELKIQYLQNFIHLPISGYKTSWPL